MCNTSLHPLSDFVNSSTEPLAFSTYHLLRTCNRFMIPSTDSLPYHNSIKEATPTQLHNSANRDTNNINGHPKPSSRNEIESVSAPIPPKSNDKTHSTQKLTLLTPLTTGDVNLEAEPVQNDYIQLPSLPLFSTPNNGSLFVNKPPLPAFEYITTANHGTASGSDISLIELNRFNGIFPTFLHRRPRGEKRPIPEEQKDEKYYERRKRNNEAAKKSRDARKIREDRIVFRAALLERENSILRAQVLALRDELQTMRQLVNNSMPLVTNNMSTHIQT